MLQVIFFSALVAVACGRGSPNANKVEELINSQQGSRYSTDILEDSLLDVPGLITKYGYPVEVHHVVTTDGYIVEVHRIPHGRDRNNKPDPKKKVVFLMHGLLSSSADYVVLGPTNALAYILAEEGYDVWLGNARGNYYSRKHVSLNPDSRFLNFWRFSWDEIGNLDLPAVIDFILYTSGQKKLHYIGHSQGSTTFLVLNSLRPEYNDKIISFHGLAPAAIFTHNDNEMFNSLARYEKVLENTAYSMGMGELFGGNTFFESFLGRFCGTTNIFATLCSFFTINGEDMNNYYNSIHHQPITFSLLGLGSFLVERVWAIIHHADLVRLGGYHMSSNFVVLGHAGFLTIFSFTVIKTMIPIFLGHAPAGASVRQVAHYGQSINTDTFRRYSFGARQNLLTYGRMTPPNYDLSKITAPAYIYYGLNDKQVHHKDVHILASRLPNLVKLTQVGRESFTHFDFIWAKDVRQMLYDQIVEKLKEAENA